MFWAKKLPIVFLRGEGGTTAAAVGAAYQYIHKQVLSKLPRVVLLTLRHTTFVAVPTYDTLGCLPACLPACTASLYFLVYLLVGSSPRGSGRLHFTLQTQYNTTYSREIVCVCVMLQSTYLASQFYPSVWPTLVGHQYYCSLGRPTAVLHTVVYC